MNGISPQNRKLSAKILCAAAYVSALLRGGFSYCHKTERDTPRKVFVFNVFFFFFTLRRCFVFCVRYTALLENIVAVNADRIA